MNIEPCIFKDIVDKTSDSIVIIDEDGGIIYWNDASEKLFGYTYEEVHGRYVHDVLPAHHMRKQADKSFCRYKATKQGKIFGETLQVEALHKDGRIIDVYFTLNKIPTPNGHMIFAILKDISLLIEHQKNLQKASETDYLTGLYNRRTLDHLLTQRFVAQDKQVALFMIDIDDFKIVNDKLGHLVGDQVIATVASRLTQRFGNEAIVGRFGGEEYCICMDISSPQQALAQASDMVRSISNTPLKINIEPYELVVTVSVGVSIGTLYDNSVNSILLRADSALYRAKRLGKNTARLLEEECMYSAEMQKPTVEVK